MRTRPGAQSKSTQLHSKSAKPEPDQSPHPVPVPVPESTVRTMRISIETRSRRRALTGSIAASYTSRLSCSNAFVLLLSATGRRRAPGRTRGRERAARAGRGAHDDRRFAGEQPARARREWRGDGNGCGGLERGWLVAGEASAGSDQAAASASSRPSGVALRIARSRTRARCRRERTALSLTASFWAISWRPRSSW